MNKLRYELVDKAWNKIDPGHYGEASLADMFSAFDGSRHPDCYTNKITPEDAQADFQESFDLHHNTVHNYEQNKPISRDEFLEFYSFLSACEASDHKFDQLVTGCWNLDNRNNYDALPYAGTPQTVTKVDAHQQWKLDNHRKLYKGNESDIIANSNSYQNDWATTQKTRHAEPWSIGNQAAGSVSWPAGANPTWSGGLMDDGQRMATLQEQYYDQEQ